MNITAVTWHFCYAQCVSLQEPKRALVWYTRHQLMQVLIRDQIGSSG